MAVGEGAWGRARISLSLSFSVSSPLTANSLTGHWLEMAGGGMLHIIQEDPSVPKRIHGWKEEWVGPS
jgi:hypothetical protein